MGCGRRQQRIKKITESDKAGRGRPFGRKNRRERGKLRCRISGCCVKRIQVRGPQRGGAPTPLAATARHSRSVAGYSSQDEMNGCRGPAGSSGGSRPPPAACPGKLHAHSSYTRHSGSAGFSSQYSFTRFCRREGREPGGQPQAGQRCATGHGVQRPQRGTHVKNNAKKRASLFCGSCIASMQRDAAAARLTSSRGSVLEEAALAWAAAALSSSTVSQAAALHQDLVAGERVGSGVLGTGFAQMARQGSGRQWAAACVSGRPLFWSAQPCLQPPGLAPRRSAACPRRAGRAGGGDREWAAEGLAENRAATHHSPLAPPAHDSSASLMAASMASFLGADIITTRLGRAAGRAATRAPMGRAHTAGRTVRDCILAWVSRGQGEGELRGRWAPRQPRRWGPGTGPTQHADAAIHDCIGGCSVCANSRLPRCIYACSERLGPVPQTVPPTPRTQPQPHPITPSTSAGAMRLATCNTLPAAAAAAAAAPPLRWRPLLAAGSSLAAPHALAGSCELHH